MSGADLGAHRVPQHVIAFVEQNREDLQRAVQDQNGFCAGLTSPRMRHSIAALKSRKGPVFRQWLEPHSLFLVTSNFNKCNGKFWSKGKESRIRCSQVSCGWPSHPAIDRAINKSIEYLVDGSPDNCSWRWGAEPGWGHVRPDERGCGEQRDFWFSPSAVSELYANMEAVSRRNYGGEAMGGWAEENGFQSWLV